MPLSIEKKIHNYVEGNHPFFSTSVDSYLKWLPYATVFGLSVAGVRTRSDWKKQVLLTAATDAIRYFITDNLKKIVHEHRPGPRIDHHSFPSGHTSSSFAGAEFMHSELRGSISVLSCVGYLAGTATGVIRIYKNKHWLKDVVAGAAIGIISAKVAYLVVNKFWRKGRGKAKNTDPIVAEKMQAEVV